MLGRLFVKDKGFYRTVAVMALPVVLQNLITIAVNMLDTIMLGAYGEIQLSGSSLANEFISLYQILCLGIGGGAAVLTSQYWGAKDVPAVRRVVALMLRVSLGIALLFMVATLFIPETIMRIYADEQPVIEAGALYFRISAPTFLLTGIITPVTVVLRSVRQVRLPLIASIISFSSNLVLNYILIFGKLGLPEMQIAGAALATVLARIIEAGIILVYLLGLDKRIGMRFRHLFARCGDMLRPYLHYSVPVIISDFLLGLGNTAVSIVIGHLGSSFVSANAIISQTVRLSTVMNQGISNAGGVMTGNTLGRGDRDTAYRQGVTFLMLSVLMGLLAAVIILAVCPPVINAYNITQETKDIAFQLMYAIAIMVVFQATQSMLTKGVLRNGGDTRFLMVADIAFMWLVSIPLGWLAGYVWFLSPFWIYVFLKIDYIIKTVWCTIRLKRKTWMHGFTAGGGKAVKAE
ncbi:MAG: MATE family efflux transporter [Clostridiales bacterium]|nr:MATE family efflux transporter [Clostridiales bacterium]